MDTRKAANGSAHCKYQGRDLSQRRKDTWEVLSVCLSMIVDHFNNKQRCKSF